MCPGFAVDYQNIHALARPASAPAMQDALAAGLRQQLVEAREEGAATEERVSAAEERQQQLEVALNENHASLQQRNAELALVRKVRGTDQPRLPAYSLLVFTNAGGGALYTDTSAFMHLLSMQEVDDTKATCQLLQKDREQLIDHNAALTERVDQLQSNLERSDEVLRRSQQDAAAALDVSSGGTSCIHGGFAGWPAIHTGTPA